MKYTIFCNVDEDGNIIESLTGIDVIPSKDYQYKFETDNVDAARDIHLLKVNLITGELIRK